MQKSLLSILLLLTVVGMVSVENSYGQIISTDTLYTCGSNGNSDHDLHLRNKTTGVSISSNVWNVTGLSQTVDACNGLAQDPTDLQWYAMIQDSGFRYLTKININDGTGSDPLVVSVDESGIASLAISNNGTFYATIGGGEDIIGTIDKSTGTFTPQCVMGNTLAGINRVSYDYTNDRLMVLQDNDSGFSSISIITDLSPATCVFTELSVTGSNVGHALSMAFHTVDNIFYTWLQSNITGEEVYHSINPVTEVSTFINDMDGTLDTFTYSVGSAFAFAEESDTTPPVITTVSVEPITVLLGTVVDELDFISCIDDTDGDITNSVVLGGAGLDVDDRGVQFVEYICTDLASNISEKTVQFIIKQVSKGGSSASTVNGGGVTSPSPSLSDIPTLSFQSDVQATTDRVGTNIADLFASLFDDRITEGITTPTPAPSVSTPSPSITDSSRQFFDTIRDFFRNLFG